MQALHGFGNSVCAAALGSHLEQFAAEHDIKLGTIADLIRYRIENERTVVRVTESKVDTEFGPFTLYSFEDEVDKVLHFAMVRGEIDAETPTLVRVHVRNTLADMLGGNPTGGALGASGIATQTAS